MNCHDISIRPTSWPDDVCQCLPARHRTKDHPNIVKSHGVYYERCPEKSGDLLGGSWTGFQWETFDDFGKPGLFHRLIG